MTNKLRDCANAKQKGKDLQLVIIAELGECVRWGGGVVWWVVSGSGKGVQNLMGW